MTVLSSKPAPTIPKADEHSSLELFAGAGGLALGLEQAGFSPLVLVERDEQAVQTLRRNGMRDATGHSEWPVQAGDVRGMDFRHYWDVDLLSAGPPCQPFSIGGRRRGPDDERDLLPETIRVISEVMPKSFVIENVRGLTFPAARDYLDYTLAQLRAPSRRSGLSDPVKHWAELDALPANEQDYQVSWRLLNAADYGCAQQRVRLLIVGMRMDMPAFEWPDPSHSRSELDASMERGEYWEEHGIPVGTRTELLQEVRQVRSPLATGEGGGGLRWRTVRDVFRELGPPGTDAADPLHHEIPGARLYRKHRGSHLDLPAKTIKAGVHGTPGGEHIALLDDGSHRYFTIRECAAIQGFPGWYSWPSLRSVAMRQIGNAVPVEIGHVVGRALNAAFSSEGTGE